MTLVSAIITTHNRKELLVRAMDSVMNQTYPEIELIVVDDASDDGTAELCKDKKLKYIYIPKSESRGGNYARNLGIKASRGDYCAFLDDDDYWLPEKIAKQVALIEEKKCDVVSCNRLNENVSGTDTHIVEAKPMLKKDGDISRKILYSICSTTSLMLIRRETLLAIGLFDEKLRFWQEYELSIRLAQLSPFFVVQEPLVVYRIDKKDSNRLTNKYYEWKDSVKYIYFKHKVLYSQLSFHEKLLVRRLYWKDAKLRTGAAGLKLQWYYCRMQILALKVLLKFI